MGNGTAATFDGLGSGSRTMSVFDAVTRRASVRAFSSAPVGGDVLKQLLTDAAQAPSGGNLQPWHVHALAGAPLRHLCDTVAASPPDSSPESPVYPENLWEPYRSRRFRGGEALYASIALARDDRPARLRQLSRNFRFFDAPVGIFLFIDRRMGRAQWLDIGMYLQTLMLLAVERGLDTCPQLAWSAQARVVARVLQVHDDLTLACGIALGHRAADHPINSWRTERAAFPEWGVLHGFDALPEDPVNEGQS